MAKLSLADRRAFWETLRSKPQDMATVGKLLGLEEVEELAGAWRRVSVVGEAEPRPFSAYVTSNSTLRQALDAIVTSRTRVAVVASEGQRYAGILTLERISKEIVS